MAGVAQIALAGVFLVTLRRWPAVQETEAQPARAPLLATLRRPIVLCSVLVFLAYTGVETAVGAWTFTLLTESRGMPAMAAGPTVSLFWTGLTAGRVLGAALGQRLVPDHLVAVCLAGICLGTGLLAAGFDATTDAAGLLVGGVAAGPVFPTLIATTPGRVGVASAGTVVGFQIAAAATGQALLPAMLGAVGDRLGVGVLGVGLVVMATLPLALHRLLARLSVARTTATRLTQTNLINPNQPD